MKNLTAITFMKPAKLTRMALAALTTLAIVPLAEAQTISLNSTMNGNSFISEDAVTGSFARINAGNGSLGSVGSNTGDGDGTYNIANVSNPNPGPLWGTPMDIFPREANFQVGSLTYNGVGATGIGTETFAITAYNLSAFWSADPNRLNAAPGAAPTVISDISDHGLGQWFFNAPGSILFGALDASDTVTFTDGALTSINLAISTSFTIDSFGLVWDGTFSISGANLSYQINDSADTFLGPSTLVADLTGTVNAVTVVPEPSSLALAGLGAAALLFRRNHRS